MEIIIYHNPRCSKSRNAISILNKLNIKYKVVNYIKDGLLIKDLDNILEKLNMDIIEIVRVNEEIWKKKYRNKNLDTKEIKKIIIDHPKILQRPIIIKGKSAAIARSNEDVMKILSYKH